MSRIPETLYSIKASQFTAVELPSIKEVRGKDWMGYGANNLFPQEMIEIYNTSAMHATAVHAVANATKGQGLALVGEDHVNLDGETLDDIFAKITLDYVLFGGYSLNLVWNKEGTRIAEIYHIPFAKVRSGKENEDGEITHYYYSSDWSNIRKYVPKEYRKFNPTDNKKENASQIFYVYDYQPGQDYYPLPSYFAAITDCDLDARISRFHNQNLKNGVNPSMFIQFRSGIPTPDERQTIYREIDAAFSGEENAGKFFMSFSRPGEEMEVTPIESANSDYYVVLEQRITSRILTAHSITSAKLLGISEASGFSNNADEIKIAYQHFLATTIKPKQEKLLKTLEFVLRFYGLTINLRVIPNEILPTVEEAIEIQEKIEDTNGVDSIINQ